LNYPGWIQYIGCRKGKVNSAGQSFYFFRGAFLHWWMQFDEFGDQVGDQVPLWVPMYKIGSADEWDSEGDWRQSF